MHHHDPRPLRDSDLDRVATLHRRLLPLGLFPRLGLAFLRRYHATFVASPHAIALAAPGDGTPDGFLVGTLDQRAHRQWVLRHRAGRLVLAGLVGLLTHPPALAQFLRTRVGRYLRGLLRMLRPPTARAGPRHPADDAPVAVLTHVAVDPERHGDGLGRQLTEELVDRAVDTGAREVRLVTRTHGGAGRFYERLGWVATAWHRTLDHTTVTEYRMPILVGARRS